MQKFLLYNSVEPEELPTLRELNTIEICKIWSAISRHIYKQLLQKRAVEIGIGSFAVVPTHATVAEGKVLPIERPMFILNKPVKMFYKETPIVNPDFEAITANTHFRHEIVDHCVQETLLCFAGALRDNKEVEFSFRGIGILAVRAKVVTMNFFDACLLELDTTGNMLQALLEDPKMMSIVAFPGQNDFSRISQEVILLPSLVVETPHQPSAHPVSLKPRRASAPWGGAARRVSVLDPVFLARRRISQVSQLSMEADHARDKEAGPGGHLALIQEKTEMMLKHPTSPAQQGLKTTASTSRPSEVRRHPLYTEKEEKELQLLLASKRHEVEAEVWRKYFANRAVTEYGQTSCPYVFEDPYRPPDILRKAYSRKLKERVRQRRAKSSGLEQQAQLQFSSKVLEETNPGTKQIENLFGFLSRFPGLPKHNFLTLLLSGSIPTVAGF
ncbi:hypothetical protein HGM15179_012521 [Zosterops borbonicus]|uniref:Coiled-coil domain-containing protein 81 n=1 Tax=Zosterops borbonicus TaxID=364589 RepID=A0A8K1LI82_9PASS|nr:hypothetical protein HGM15179_012521 [Zosterops borbonicus]